MSKNHKIEVQGIAVWVTKINEDDYISLTDIARQKDAIRSDYILQNWMRNRSTLEYLGLWEHLNNPDFNSIEFDGIKIQAGSYRFKQLNQIAFSQMTSLLNAKGFKKIQ
ncbi:KilA-N domain-containing protein [Rhodonellum sp.]|uniref:KilA-N domain-containing protein n=1 Tax=Rhodonellum sp. TaxID=2231180 RepID=UPI00271E16F1|nr:KilA-N domain-containing protein [Rhodonellum sp.]MDO9553294.1 KilA-N domain-containing protein [Rhodonellum sp.]